MSTAHDIPELDAKGLRKFGLTTAAIFVVLFDVVGPLIKRTPLDALPTWPLIAAAIFGVPALVYPPSLKPIYWVWMRIGAVLGFINTRIILGVFYFVLLFPLALVLRVSGKANMRAGYDKTKNTYRIPTTPREPQSMEAPF
jgi:hypothetical protein